MQQRAAVLGFGVTGESVVRHLLREGVEPVVMDTRSARTNQFDGVDFRWNVQQWPGTQVDYAVVSPGLDMDAALVRGAADAGVPLLSDIDLFFEAVNEPVIGITGTNGKSTVTSLAGHLLNTSGTSCGVGGNLGLAALDTLDEKHACYVLELSSFQLERSREHPFHAATVLNVTEDHLDKHGDMESYAASKQRIYSRSQRCVYNRADALTQPAGDRHNSDAVVSFGCDLPPSERDWGIAQDVDERWVVHGHSRVCTAAQFPLPGAHNELNMLAACALVDGLVQADQLVAGLNAYEGLPHRFAHVAELAGVVYINDSKATNLGATLAALEGMPCNNQVLLIAGGDAKGVDLTALGAQLPGRVRQVFSLGKDSAQLQRIAQDCDIPALHCQSLTQAVRSAANEASCGDTVLLSPACASLDMFDNYMQRGEQFAQAVLELKSEVQRWQ